MMLTEWFNEKQSEKDLFSSRKPSTNHNTSFHHLPKMEQKKVEELNHLLQMIGDQFKNEQIYFIFVHQNGCWYCKKSLPFWRTLEEELTRRLPHFYSDEIEISQTKTLKNKQQVTGKQILQGLSARGVPSILGNGRGRNGRFHSFPEGMRVVWDVIVHPFHLLREVFGVK